jgi:hypothetical protein
MERRDDHQGSCDRDVTPDPFMAFCAAYTKKMFGSTTKILEAIDRADEKARRKREKQRRRELNEHKRAIEKEKFDADVERKRYELAVEKRARMLEETVILHGAEITSPGL